MPNMPHVHEVVLIQLKLDLKTFYYIVCSINKGNERYVLLTMEILQICAAYNFTFPIKKKTNTLLINKL